MNELSCMNVMLFGAAWARAAPSRPPTADIAEIVSTSRRDAAWIMFAIASAFPSVRLSTKIVGARRDGPAWLTLGAENRPSQLRLRMRKLPCSARCSRTSTQQELPAQFNQRFAVVFNYIRGRVGLVPGVRNETP